MIPLSKILQMRAEKERKTARAAAVDSADECTAEDPSKCRVHGIKALERTDEVRKNKVVNPYGGNPLTKGEAIAEIKKCANAVICPQSDLFEHDGSLDSHDMNNIRAIFRKIDFSEDIDFEKSVRAVGESLKYLKERYGAIKIPKLLFVMAARMRSGKGHPVVGDTLGIENEGTGELRYAVVFASYSGKNELSYNHGDYRNDYDYVRHEIGHAIALANGVGDSQFRQFCRKRMTNSEWNQVMGKVSNYAKRDSPEGEAVAECFSLYTSPDYDGRLGKTVEAFIKVHLTGEQG